MFYKKLLLSREEIKNFRDSHTKNSVKLFHFIALCGFSYGYTLLYKDINYIVFPFYFYVCSPKLTFLFYIFSCLLKQFYIQVNIYKIISLIISSYLLTDISHIIFKEKTYRSKYDKIDQDYILTKIKHHLYLPLLILDSIFYKPCYYSYGTEKANQYLLNYGKNVKVEKKFTNISLNYDVDISHIIDKFLTENNLNLNYEYVQEINELYITNGNYKSSNLDKIVDKYHIDGHIPNIFGINTYRVLICLHKDENDPSKTIFKDFIPDENTNYVIFDYNQQLHKANISNLNHDNRICIKLHFITYSKYISKFFVNFYKNTLIYTNKLMRKVQNNNNNNYYILPDIKKELLRNLEI